MNRILFYNSGGGIGDAVQILPLINALKKHFKNAELYYLCAHKNHFNTSLKDLNCSINTLELNIKYFGFRWRHILKVKSVIKKLNIKKFDLIIDLQSKIRNTLILKMIPHNYFISSCFNFFFTKPKVTLKKKINVNDNILQAVNTVTKSSVTLSEYNIDNISENFYNEAKRLLPKNNYVGFSITQGNVYRKKEWPIEKIAQFALEIKKKNKTPVFFIEKKNVELKNKIQKVVPGAIFPEHESNLESPALVVSLSKRLDFALSIDNGVMHMMALSKIPMIVLFGPTDSSKFAPRHDKVIILDSKLLNNTKDISSINVEDVLKAARQHLKF